MCWFLVDVGGIRTVWSFQAGIGGVLGKYAVSVEVSEWLEIKIPIIKEGGAKMNIAHPKNLIHSSYLFVFRLQYL